MSEMEDQFFCFNQIVLHTENIHLPPDLSSSCQKKNELYTI